MPIALDILALLLLLAGLFLCGVNACIALRNLRAQAERYVSMVPLIPTLFTMLGLALLLRDSQTGMGGFLLPFMLLDLSVVSLLLLPFHLLIHKLRGKDAPPLLPRELRLLLLIFYLLVMGFAALLTGVVAFSERDEAHAAAELHRDSGIVERCFRLPAGDMQGLCYRIRSLAIGGNTFIPAHDAGHEAEGCLRLDRAQLPAQGGTPAAAPPCAEDYGAPALTDWQESPDFTRALLLEHRKGTILYSPGSGWVYFKIH